MTIVSGFCQVIFMGLYFCLLHSVKFLLETPSLSAFLHWLIVSMARSGGRHEAVHDRGYCEGWEYWPICNGINAWQKKKGLFFLFCPHDSISGTQKWYTNQNVRNSTGKTAKLLWIAGMTCRIYNLSSVTDNGHIKYMMRPAFDFYMDTPHVL